MNEEKELKKLYKNMDTEYYKIVEHILQHPEFQRRKEFHHHENRSVYTHSLMVSMLSYKIAKTMHVDYVSAAIGGLLHDFYYEDWQLNINKKCKLRKKHGFIHASQALANAKKYFPDDVNAKVADIIKEHMFPLTLLPPRYLESWIITVVDKYVSLEVFKEPNKLYKYVGLSGIIKGRS